ncbi:MAG: helix-turn-helix domain-containing protein [Thermoplasmata archaeon]|nr:helix-turn-helix domain-containing protein [Thermoplasmata archaeon]
MTEPTLDELMMVLENPLRRRILAIIARERHYPLQLSRELRVSQQAVTKHLQILEKYGLVKCDREPSTLGGPERKNYCNVMHLSLTIDVGPSVFSTEFRSLAGAETIPRDLVQYKDDIEGALEEDDPKARLGKVSEVAREMDGLMEELDEKRSGLLKLKDAALNVAYSAVEEISSDYDERRVLYHLINEKDMRVNALSESLDLREEHLRRILSRLREEELI